MGLLSGIFVLGLLKMGGPRCVTGGGESKLAKNSVTYFMDGPLEGNPNLTGWSSLKCNQNTSPYSNIGAGGLLETDHFGKIIKNMYSLCLDITQLTLLVLVFPHVQNSLVTRHCVSCCKHGWTICKYYLITQIDLLQMNMNYVNDFLYARLLYILNYVDFIYIKTIVQMIIKFVKVLYFSV